MNKLQLALLTRWAEDSGEPGIRGRKRMQKVIYFLQQADCPIEADYILHHYGPYSREVANVTDIMVAEGLLVERSSGGGEYEYSLGSNTRSMIDRLPRHQATQAFETYRDRAVELLRQDLRHLEIGSTILYFYRHGCCKFDWDTALREACRYKRIDPEDSVSKAALALAQRFAPDDAA